MMGSQEKKGKKVDNKESKNKESKHQKLMKRISISDSFKGTEEVDVSLFPISSVEEKEKYEERRQSLLLSEMEEVECDEELCSNGSSSLGQKKRRLSVDQVKALEKDFEMDNKLDPERKVRLAQELGLLPRQIAVWFQNRRARWKTKQLERDYDALKARHDALKLDVDAVRGNKEALMAEVRELKAKLADSATAKMEEIKVVEEEGRALVFKDGTSDSDSSVVFNEETRPPFSGVLPEQQCLLGTKSHCTSFMFECHRVEDGKSYLEEGFLSGEELCGSLFSEEQAPSLSWCCTERWE